MTFHKYVVKFNKELIMCIGMVYVEVDGKIEKVSFERIEDYVNQHPGCVSKSSDAPVSAGDLSEEERKEIARKVLCEDKTKNLQ